MPSQLQPDLEIPRVTGVAQFIWKGGDPAVDLPRVVLERLDGDNWVEVQTDAGHTITDTLPGIWTAHTPDPLYPHDVAQTHYWWAGWQVVPHSGLRTAMPEGEYRLHVYGHVAADSSDTWPYETAEYSLDERVVHRHTSGDQLWRSTSPASPRASMAPSTDIASSIWKAPPLARTPSVTPHYAGFLRWEYHRRRDHTDHRRRSDSFLRHATGGAISVEVSDPDGNHSILEIE